MKVALAFFGLPRSTAHTFGSIESRLLRPLRRYADCRVFHHLYRQARVKNPRSGEDATLDASNYAPFEAFEGEFEDRDLAATHPLHAQVAAFGNAWEGDALSLDNLLWQLKSLERVTALLAPWQPDVVVYARPDQRYHDPLQQFDLARAVSCPREVSLPGWGAWGGCNDRFAVCGKEAFTPYGNRIRQAVAYCHAVRAPLHSERLLRFALDRAGLAVRPMPLRASRVRVDGRVEPEPFEQMIRL